MVLLQSIHNSNPVLFEQCMLSSHNQWNYHIQVSHEKEDRNRDFNMLYEISPFPYLCIEKLMWENFFMKLPLFHGYNNNIGKFC